MVEGLLFRACFLSFLLSFNCSVDFSRLQSPSMSEGDSAQPVEVPPTAGEEEVRQGVEEVGISDSPASVPTEGAGEPQAEAAPADAAPQESSDAPAEQAQEQPAESTPAEAAPESQSEAPAAESAPAPEGSCMTQTIFFKCCIDFSGDAAPVTEVPIAEAEAFPQEGDKPAESTEAPVDVSHELPAESEPVETPSSEGRRERMNARTLRCLQANSRPPSPNRRPPPRRRAARRPLRPRRSRRFPLSPPLLKKVSKRETLGSCYKLADNEEDNE